MPKLFQVRIRLSISYITQTDNKKVQVLGLELARVLGKERLAVGKNAAVENSDRRTDFFRTAG